MTKNNKFVLSLATIAILSGTNALATAVNIDNAALKDKGDSSGVYTADVSTADETDGVTITSKIEKKDDIKDMTKLVISTDKKLAIGTSSQSSGVVSIGGTKPTGDAQADGYGFDINAKSLTTAGATNNGTELNVNANSSISTSGGTTLNANSAINIAKGKTLTINSGGLTASNGTISIGSGSTLSVNGALSNSSSGTISLGGGTLTANGKATLDGAKLTLTEGGTLNFNGAGADNASTISGAVSSTSGKALNINLGRNSQLTFSDSLTLVNNESGSLDELVLGGGILNVAKLDADATNLNTTSGGTINFTDSGTAQTAATGSKITNDFTIGSGTAMNLGKNVYLTLGGADKSVTTKGSKISFADSTSTLNVSNLSANASDFDMSKGGKIVFAKDSKSSISGNATLGENASYVFSAAGTLNLDSLALTKTGNIEFAGKDSVLNLKNGMSADDAKNQIKLSEGGTINFSGGNSVIKGKDNTDTNRFTTTANKDTLFNVKGGSLNLENVKLDSEKSILTIDGGVVNAAGLTTTNAANLNLKSGTLNFNQSAEDAAKDTFTLTTSTIGADLDLLKAGAQVNFNSGSLVKIGTDSKGTLSTAAGNNLNLGGQIELGKLVSKSSADSSLTNVNFGSASVSLSGNLVGKDTTNPAKFTIGTDKDGNSIIGASGEKVEIGETSTNSALTLKSGVTTTNAALTTATDSKLVFGGGSLNVGAGGSLTIADTSKNLELKDGVGGLLTLKGDGTKGGAMTISKGDLDLSNTAMGISVEQGGQLIISASAAGIIGKGNKLSLTKFADIVINGKISGGASGLKFGGTTLAEAYKVAGDLTLQKETTLGIITRADNDGNLKEVEVDKIATEKNGNNYTTATLAFGTGSVKLTGATTNTSLKLNNQGFGSALTLADKSVLEFASGSVNVKGALGVETGKTATLKVSNAVANLNGGLGEIAADKGVNKIELDNGALNIKQDKLTATGLDITHIQRSASGISSAMNIDGEASITSSKFAILPLVETGATSYKVLSTTKGLTISDLNDKTTGEFRTRNSLNSILGKYGLSVADASKIKDGDKVIAAKDSSVNVTLKNDGKNLFLERELTNLGSLSDVKVAKIQADIDMLTAMASDIDIVEASNKSNVENLATDLKALQNSAKNQSNVELAAEMGGSNSDILLSAFGVKSGATSSQTRNAIMLDIMETGGAGIVKDIKDGASSVANMSSSTSSVMNTMNLSNDMAISGRIAQANNPYGNLAQGFAGYEYAAVQGDMPLYYANNGYKNGFWANAIGGLNKVEGESGILMGLSAGFDRQLENTLVGFYLSYAIANLNDKVVEQSADNIQVGLYTSFNQRDIEVNVKAYGQLAVTETTAVRGSEGEATAKFNRLYGGISANIGSIFAFNNNSTFVKPYIGENYYYAHTPAYEETRDSTTALSVKSANNHALSFDVGVDVRQYWNENSFVYITPSVERYVVNSGGDYTAGFLGSDTTFTIEGKSKTKTYGQVLLGGNIALGDKLNINVGLGAKKIFMGKFERDNGDEIDELYLSGNLGVKYRF